MRVLQVVHGYPPQAKGGTELYTASLVAGLRQHHEVAVFSADRSPDQSQTLSTEVTYWTRPQLDRQLRYQVFDAQVRVDFARSLQDFRPDVVHIQHVIGLSADLIEVAQSQHIPVVVTLHDYWWLSHHHQLLSWNSRRIRWSKPPLSAIEDVMTLDRDLYDAMRGGKWSDIWWTYGSRSTYLLSQLNQARTVLAQSQFTYDAYKQADPSLEMQIIPLGVERFKLLPKTTSPKIRFGYIGHLSTSKGIHVLIDAAAQLPTDEMEIHLYGSGQDYWQSLGVADPRIVYHGPYSPTDLGSIFSQIDVLIVPAIWDETYSLVAREAYLGLTPVIASRSGALPELVKDGHNGLLFIERSSLDLARAMHQVIETPTLIQEFLAQTPEVPTVDEHLQRIEQVYDQVLGNQH